MSQRKQMAHNIRSLVVPLNMGATAGLRDAAKAVAPIAGCHKYHKTCEIDRRKDAENEVSKRWKKAKKVTILMEIISSYL